MESCSSAATFTVPLQGNRLYAEPEQYKLCAHWICKKYVNYHLTILHSIWVKEQETKIRKLNFHDQDQVLHFEERMKVI